MEGIFYILICLLISIVIEFYNKFPRSGAGKSSFLSTLLRMTPWEGDIMIDSKSIKNISLEKLRDIYSIIPQKPLILHASIRENLDPLDKYSDEKIWNALEAVQLKIIIANLGRGLHLFNFYFNFSFFLRERIEYSNRRK